MLFDERENGFLPYLTAEFFRTGKPDKFVNVRKETGIEIVNPDDIVLIWDGSKADDTFTGLKGVLASTMIRARFYHDQGRCQNIKRAKS